MGVSSFKKIELPYFFSKDFTNVHIDLSNLEKTKITSKTEFTGAMAYNTQAYLYFRNPRERESLEKDLLENYNIKTDFANYKIENTDIEDVGIKPLIINAQYSADDLIKKAGENIIFQIGAVIGKQMEFYSDKPRKMPIALSSARSYERTITLEIPEGYYIKNLNDLNMNVYLDETDKNLAYFTVVYKMDKNTLTISNLEGYNFVEIPIKYWDQYRKVVNAAADFNKLALILEKK